MAAEGYKVNGNSASLAYRVQPQTMSPLNQVNNPFDTETNGSNHGNVPERGTGMDTTVALLIRKLPSQTTPETLRTMLLFAKDCLGIDFISPDFQHPQDQGYRTAIAQFRTPAAAEDVRALLNGKQNNPNEAPLYVEIMRLSPGSGLGNRRARPDIAFNRANSSSSTTSSGGQVRQSSRFNGTFQAMDQIAPSNGVPGFPNGGPFSPAEGLSVASPPPFFTPQSPIGQPTNDRHRVSGKSVIGEDGVDDEPADLLKDPVAYARNDMSGQLSRHPTNPQLPMSRFANLSLATNGTTSPSLSGFTSPRGPAPIQSPTSAIPPSVMGSLGPNTPYQMGSPHHQRHNYPPVNPADQNPPCNTLYVGNLPIDTSEDELKAMFSKQRGYKRLCFRTKQNGPMCFVEFEDISSATKTLNELYGHPLHNSVKGGIRLSFSKNPLGVRTGQPGGMGSQAPLSPSGPMPGMNGLGIAPFSTANGPPPGLAAPPGLNSPLGNMNGMMGTPSIGGGFGMDLGMGMGMSMRGRQAVGMTTGWAGQNAQYSDYMYGR